MSVCNTASLWVTVFVFRKLIALMCVCVCLYFIGQRERECRDAISDGSYARTHTHTNRYTNCISDFILIYILHSCCAHVWTCLACFCVCCVCAQQHKKAKSYRLRAYYIQLSARRRYTRAPCGWLNAQYCSLFSMWIVVYQTIILMHNCAEGI